MKEHSLQKKIIEIVLMVVAAYSIQSYAHEPLFGLGPHTIYKYGYALETEFEKGSEGWANQLELIYGITADWAVTVSVPYLFYPGKQGMGNVTIRSKFRFFRNDLPGASKQAALHGGTALPSVNGTDATDFFLGLSYGYESRRHYFFSGMRYRFNGAEGKLKRGNILLLDAAYGIRPWLLEYLQPDPVFLLEINSQWQSKSVNDTQNIEASGGYIISLSPGLLFSYRNIMLKAGVKIPVINGLKNSLIKPDSEYILGLEFHFPPLY